LNYAHINLLSSKRLNYNLINSVVEELQFLVKIYTKKTLKTRKSKSTEEQNWSKETHFQF